MDFEQREKEFDNAASDFHKALFKIVLIILVSILAVIFFVPLILEVIIAVTGLTFLRVFYTIIFIGAPIIVVLLVFRSGLYAEYRRAATRYAFRGPMKDSKEELEKKVP